MRSAEREKLLRLLVCPRSRGDLQYVAVGQDEALLCRPTGVLYPIIDGVVIMDPVTRTAKSLCTAFLQKNRSSLAALGADFDMEASFRALSLDSHVMENKWRQQEMSYWESLFESQLRNPNERLKRWHRTLPRKRLLDRVPITLNNKIILEIGCGGASTLHEVYGDTITMYIGLDLSFNACRLAQKLFQEGLFIQASAESLPLRHKSIDCIVGYGVLHHLPKHELHLRNMLLILKYGGFFIGSDPVLKPRIPRPQSLLKRKRGVAQIVRDNTPEIGGSPHNEWIDWDNFVNVISGNARLLDVWFEYSPLQHLLIMLFYERFKVRSKLFAEVAIALDRLWLMTVGRMHRSLGPAGVIYTIQRRDSHQNGHRST